jgi:hypothetical protein
MAYPIHIIGKTEDKNVQMFPLDVVLYVKNNPVWPESVLQTVKVLEILTSRGEFTH